MNISVYLWSIAAVNLYYPYKASIESILPLADEIVIAYDPEFEDFSIFADMSPKVKGVIRKYDVKEWDIRNKMLQAARSQCLGDWCIYWQLGAILHERSVDNLKNTILKSGDYDAITVAEITYDSNRQANLHENGYITRISKNLSHFQHKTPSRAIGVMDSDFYDGKYILLGWDDSTLCNIITDEWFMPGARKCQVKDVGFCYYTWYNLNRKHAHGAIEKGFMGRVYGRNPTFDVNQYYNDLKTPIKFARNDPTLLKKTGFHSAGLDDPMCIREWIMEMDEPVLTSRKK